MKKLFDKVDLFMIGIAGAVLLLVILLMNIEIIARTVFLRSVQISDEYSGYGLCIVTMLCLVPAMRRDRYLRIEGIIEKSPRGFQVFAEAFGGIVGAIVSSVLCWSTGKLAWTSFQYGTRSIEISQTPLFIPQLMMPIGFGLLAIAFVETAICKTRLLSKTRN